MSALFGEQDAGVVEEFMVSHEEDALARAQEIIAQLEGYKTVTIDHSQFEDFRRVDNDL